MTWILSQNFQSLLAHIPYQLHIAEEAYYHSLIQCMLYLLGFDAQSEISSSKGRIDLALTIKERIFIFEFKLNKSAEAALDQVITQRYYERYLAGNKPITLVGISFNYKDKALVVDFMQKELPLASPQSNPKHYKSD